MKFQTLKVTIDGQKYDARELSAGQRKELFKMYKSEADPMETQAATIQMGFAAFKDKSIDEILDLPGTAFSSLADAIMMVSGLADDSEKEAEKNS